MTSGSDKTGGSDQVDTPAGPDGSNTGLPPDLFELHKIVIGEIWSLWLELRTIHTVTHDHVKFTRVTIVGLSQAAAVCAVDVGMTEEQFLATCKANFAEALKNAPRFG